MPNQFTDLAGLRSLGKTIARAAQPAARRAAMQAMRQQRIVSYVGATFAEPSLCAGDAARALGMSLRGLHLALAATGESFNKVVRRHRLAACQALLQAPQRSDSVTEIAFACGFNSLSSFYRALGSCRHSSGCVTPGVGGYVPSMATCP